MKNLENLKNMMKKWLIISIVTNPKKRVFRFFIRDFGVSTTRKNYVDTDIDNNLGFND